MCLTKGSGRRSANFTVTTPVVFSEASLPSIHSSPPQELFPLRLSLSVCLAVETQFRWNTSLTFVVSFHCIGTSSRGKEGPRAESDGATGEAVLPGRVHEMWKVKNGETVSDLRPPLL